MSHIQIQSQIQMQDTKNIFNSKINKTINWNRNENGLELSNPMATIFVAPISICLKCKNEYRDALKYYNDRNNLKSICRTCLIELSKESNAEDAVFYSNLGLSYENLADKTNAAFKIRSVWREEAIPRLRAIAFATLSPSLKGR